MTCTKRCAHQRNTQLCRARKICITTVQCMRVNYMKDANTDNKTDTGNFSWKFSTFLSSFIGKNPQVVDTQRGKGESFSALVAVVLKL